MSDTTDQAGENPEVALETVTIGDTELSVAEATELLESGKTMKELRAQYPDIDFKELPKSFTQTRQELADLKKTKTPEPEVEPDEAARRKQIKEFFADPLVQEELKEKMNQQESALKEDLEFEKTIGNLESEFDGSDGRPKFVKKEVLEYGMKNQIFNPKAAYKEMHEEALREWAIEQRLSRKRPTTFSEKRSGGGGKQPEIKTATTFKEATEAALAQTE